MPGTVPGNFGLKKRPATLDFSGIIAKVEWALGPNILMIRIYAQIRKPATPTAQVTSLGAYNGDAFQQVIDIHDDHVPAPVIVNPKMNPEMVSHSLVWNRAPRKSPSANETFNVYQALIFFNISRIKSFNRLQDQQYQLSINFPASKITTGSGVIYYAFADRFGNGWDYEKAHPATTGAVVDAQGHTAIVNNTISFTSAALRDAFLGYNAGSLPPWLPHDEVVADDLADLFQWEAEAWSFIKRKEFPVDDEFKPTFGTHGTGNIDQPTIVDEAKGHGFEHAHATVDHPIPSYTVSIDLNMKSMSFTMKKV